MAFGGSEPCAPRRSARANISTEYFRRDDGPCICSRLCAFRLSPSGFGLQRGKRVLAAVGFEARKAKGVSTILDTSEGPKVEITANDPRNEGGLATRLATPREPGDVVDEALAGALARASEAGRWDVVTTLARELEARRAARAAALAPADVIDLAARRR